MNDLEARMKAVFGAVLGCDSDRLTDADDMTTVRGWDSVNHLQLLLALEDALGVQFDPEEFATLTTFGALRARIARGTA